MGAIKESSVAYKNVRNILMERDGICGETADTIIDLALDEVYEILNTGDYQRAEQRWKVWTGLSLDLLDMLDPL